MEPALNIPWDTIVAFVLAASFGLWSWVLRKFGESHIESIKELASELRELRKDVNRLEIRVAVVEGGKNDRD